MSFLTTAKYCMVKRKIKSERVDEKLSNEEVKFPSGFKALSAYIHEKGLKFGMYNDIGTNLCAGAQVGTCGYEALVFVPVLEYNIVMEVSDGISNSSRNGRKVGNIQP